MASVNIDVTRLIQERDGVIRERRQALALWLNAKGNNQSRIHSEFIQPLNAQLLKLNKRLGV